ncbi:hypothetical protein HBI88_093960 [Parastagonospora nodorum]|nr:hypothetical protein HBI97_120660 [Parastagonospora nodorum]KAH5807236.1 hypothetical protein HBI96_105690 [Parastagonospora nodorum]KAH5819801.1 hypothetical protein HBI94_108030 [Parastagonospora nodorum]KAH5832061.1 hypothetical protein HBI93_117790 [Parastagonospora nodorum]KAH5864346.1 hypothetical protein HBI91_114730 [Parastagonospora nodorum]
MSSSMLGEVSPPTAMRLLSPLSREDHAFDGQIFTFSDKSRWQIEAPLSQIAPQQTRSPCEARQVFTAACIEDPSEIYGALDLAVIKIKFQVRASQATIQYLKSSLADYKKDLIHRPNSRNETQKRMDETSAETYACMNSVINTNPDSVQEAKALRHFLDTDVRVKLHDEAIICGYLIVILMKKVPGSALRYDTFCKMSRPQQGEIREAFRRALINVWGCGIRPRDKGLRNIGWDEAERECYIVDFEDCKIIDVGQVDVPEFSEAEFRHWDLAEENVVHYRTWYDLDKVGNAAGAAKNGA